MEKPTRLNGGIPPEIGTIELVMVRYSVGTGEISDPIRFAHAFYSGSKHLFTIDDSRVLALSSMPDFLATPSPEG